MIVKPNNCLKVMDEGCFVVPCQTNLLLHASTWPIIISSVLQDLFPDEMPVGLPPLREIETQIGFIPGSQIHYPPLYE